MEPRSPWGRMGTRESAEGWDQSQNSLPTPPTLCFFIPSPLSVGMASRQMKKLDYAENGIASL